MGLLNPWVILGFLVWSLAIGFQAHKYGYHSGTLDQQHTDQAAIDKVNAQIDRNKAQANAELLASKDAALKVAQERDVFKTKLLQEHQTNVETTDRLRTALDPVRLRFGADPARTGCGGENGMSETGRAPGDAKSPPVCVVSEEADRSLKSITYDADKMRDDFILLYDWAHP